MIIKKYLIPTPRPYWHVDLKWVCGLLFILMLAALLFLSALVKLTDEERGPTISALVIGSFFIRGDTLEDIEEIREEIRKQGGVIRPLPSDPTITITEKDLSLSVPEIKLKVFKPLAETLYYEGVEGAADKYSLNQEQKEKFINDASALNIFTQQTNTALRAWLIRLISISGLLLLGVVYFSSGWGRLSNPGVLLLIAGMPGSLLAILITRPPKDGSGEGPLGFLPADLAGEIGPILGGAYYWAVVLGMALLVVALIGKIITKIITKRVK